MPLKKNTLKHSAGTWLLFFGGNIISSKLLQVLQWKRNKYHNINAYKKYKYHRCPIKRKCRKILWIKLNTPFWYDCPKIVSSRQTNARQFWNFLMFWNSWNEINSNSLEHFLSKESKSPWKFSQSMLLSINWNFPFKYYQNIPPNSKH